MIDIHEWNDLVKQCEARSGMKLRFPPSETVMRNFLRDTQRREQKPASEGKKR